MKIAADFVTSALTAGDFPEEGLPEVALVGRSNVGKSSLINALVRRRLARTSSAPGKTRLANFYRVARGPAPPLYLVDLPGYGYARGGSEGFEAVTRAYFERGRRVGSSPATPAGTSAILLVDARHPGLESDLTAWRWVKTAVDGTAVVATKIDKLARGQRIRAMRQLESVLEGSVLPVSAVTGEGMDELWRLIDKLANRRSPSRRSPNRRSPNPPPRATGRRPPKK